MRLGDLGGSGGDSGDSGAAAGGDFSGLSCARAAAKDVAEVKNAMTSENTSILILILLL